MSMASVGQDDLGSEERRGLAQAFAEIGTLAIIQHSPTHTHIGANFALVANDNNSTDDRTHAGPVEHNDDVETMLRAGRTGRMLRSCAKIYEGSLRGQEDGLRSGLCPHRQWESVERKAEIFWLNGTN